MIVFIETLGCSRNQVDSEIMLGKLTAAGHTPTHDPALAQAIIVNTCGFITSAADEAVETILDMGRFKTEGACRRLVVTGCLAQRYKDDPELCKSLPEVDAFLGTAACEQIVDAVEAKDAQPLTPFPAVNDRGFQDLSVDRELSADPFAYIKVSEGCNRHCTYCIIPSLRGTQRSRPISEIVKEGRILADKGVKELILTAENTTDYGQDLDREVGLDQVLSALADEVAEDKTWIRFLYTHPRTLDAAVVQAVADHDTLCNYYDVPIQHAHSATLKRMGRPYTREDLLDLFAMIRKHDPAASLRTTVIVGFPGETEEEFQDLMDFIHDVKFDHLGVFKYSDSEDLKSHGFADHVSDEVAEERYDKIMSAQAAISQAVNQRHLNQVYQVLVEENPEEGVFIGRTMFQAPEVDGVTFIYSDGLEIGTRVHVKITDVYEYDIAGEKIE
ncbi:MAG: 30S ribosomal protein S12 methylthiotransferase RimO [Desulfobacterales bacterium]|nr:30S ribosomal protein S12 methylthiotransferase RimO [Desulfobacterales bacterium]